MRLTYVVGVMVACCALVEAWPRGAWGICSRPNEYFYSCGSACKDKRCEEDPRRRYCPAVCVPGCYCKPGHARDSSSRCIPEDQCPGRRCTGQNEYYTSCGSGCGDQRCDQPRGRRGCPRVCRRECFCNPGYARDSEERCIPIRECPLKPSCKGENEQYTECGSSCKEMKCGQDQTRACSEICMKGCYCKPGHARNSSGRCIPEDQCPEQRCKGQNEYYTSCGSGCGDQRCNQPRRRRGCPRVCRRECFCKPGYARDSEERCIPIRECSKPSCKGENEEYIECGSSCKEIKCGQDQIGPCPKICRKGCYCKPGFARDTRKRCVPVRECPIKPGMPGRE